MIVSASRRTDIPAFYSDWFFNRIREGYVLVRNPMNIHQVGKIDIRPEVVDCIVLWTKNPKMFMSRLDNLSQYQYYFQYTITGYGKQLEPKVPLLNKSIETFKQLSKMIGQKRVIWRYDPIILTEKHSIQYHVDNFQSIARNLSGYTERCVVSFVDFYKKTIKNLVNIQYSEMSVSQLHEISQSLVTIAKENGITISTCAEEIDLHVHGIEHGSCIDDKLIEEISGYNLRVNKDKSQRVECGCVASIDIGAYNTCLHGCLYCYANYNQKKAHNNFEDHDRNSGLLYGQLTGKDIVKEREVISCRVLQGSLFGKKRGAVVTTKRKREQL